MNRPLRIALATSSLALAATALTPTPAHACGGFFCDAAQPVNQAAERIIFSRGDDGAVTAIIQIQYQGPAERFAWMLPIAGNPEIGVSSDAAFTRLQQATNPQYLLNTRVEGTCADDPRLRGFGSDSASAADGGVAPPASEGGVTVVNEGNVGPYDFVVISVDPSLTEVADVAVEWLRSNGYEIDELGVERVGPYLEGGMNLLAFRLTKGNGAGSIRPVVIGFGPGLASIPIRPTAVAAVDDMGVMVWVLGPHRAVPVNYRSLELNDALIDWLNPNRNYNDVVTEAANQSGGQGFVTEMSGAAEPLANTIFQPWEREQWASLSQESTWSRGEVEVLLSTIQTFGSFDGMRDVIEGNMPLPDGVSVDDLLACAWCVNLDPDGDGRVEGFDREGFLGAMEELVIAPMEATRAFFDRRNITVTRLYTTMSADEMTVDPSFDFNEDLGPVDTLRQADRIIECSRGVSQNDAPWRVELPSGRVVRGEGGAWPFEVGDSSMPANARIRRVGTEGEGDVVVDNVDAISSALESHNRTIPRPGALGGGGGCSAAPGAGGGSLLALVGLGLVITRRRRTR